MGKWRKPTKFTVLQPTWRGIFVTCVRGRETQCACEVRNWFEAVAEELWPAADQQQDDDEEAGSDIEVEIQREVDSLNTIKRKNIVVHNRLGIECVIFAQTRNPVDPVKLCLKLCDQALKREHVSRLIQRLAPVQQFVKCDSELGDLSPFDPVLAAHLRADTSFAIRPTLRLCPATRQTVISAMAKLVGPGHRVDLQEYDELILIEGFKSILGLAVIDVPAAEVTKLCRFNIAQIIAATANEN